jgi:S-methylmethionine-dependent homocysteine/selenocysteine methylase
VGRSFARDQKHRSHGCIEIIEIFEIWVKTSKALRSTMQARRSVSYTVIREKLKARKVIVLDGPMNTELVRRGIRWRKHGLVTDTVAVEQLHREYLNAGADVVRANTFQLNRLTYLNVFRSPQHQAHIGAPGLRDLVPQLLKTAMRLIRQARIKAMKSDTVAIAGVLSPMQHCFRPDLAPKEEMARREHGFMARIFAEEKADFLIAESMNTIAEAKGALRAGRAVGLPVWVSFVLGPERELLSGEPLTQAVMVMEKGGAEAVLVSNVPPQDVSSTMPRLKAMAHVPCGGSAHIGKFSPPSWKFDFFPLFVETESWSPERYASEARKWITEGAAIVGGDGGTGPEHIAALRKAISTDGDSAGGR